MLRELAGQPADHAPALLLLVVVEQKRDFGFAFGQLDEVVLAQRASTHDEDLRVPVQSRVEAGRWCAAIFAGVDLLRRTGSFETPQELL